jgi:hypothetical protein
VKHTRRLVSLCAPFCPSGESHSICTKDFATFHDFCLQAQNHLQKERGKELARKEEKLRELQKADRLVGPLIWDALANRASVEETASAVRKLNLRQETKEELFKVFKNAISAKPKDVAKSEEYIGRMEIKLACRDKLIKAIDGINKGLFDLSEAVRAGDAYAAQGLAETAIYASRLLGSFEAIKPKLIRKVAKWKLVWPVLATGDNGWEKKAVRRIAELSVGNALDPLKARFRAARGCDENLPARRWAKAAVRTIEETRVRFLRVGFIMRDLGSSGALADFCMKNGWGMCLTPKWTRNVGTLGEFTKASEGKWASVIREMVREQIPDFHSRPEWQNQRNAAKASGRDTKGLIQNRILDDICDALESIAPNSREELHGNSTPEIP